MDFIERPNTDASIITFSPGSAVNRTHPLPRLKKNINSTLRHIEAQFQLFFAVFSSGESEKPCLLVLVDDTQHEEEEELRLVLGSPKSASPFGASIGKQNETLIKINDDADSKNALLSC